MSGDLATLLDDTIIEHLASFGKTGVPRSKVTRLARRIGMVGDWRDLEDRLDDLYLQTDRVAYPNGSDHYALSEIEWQRRQS